MVRNYPQVSFRLPPEIKTQLNALSAVTAIPQWRVITAALACFFRERSTLEQREVIERMGKSRSARPPRSRR
jgi:predicted DNA-binding protein